MELTLFLLTVAEEEQLKRKMLASSTSLAGQVQAGAATEHTSQHMLISGDEESKPYDKVRGSTSMESVSIYLKRKLKKKMEPGMDEVYGLVKERPNPHEAVAYPFQSQPVALVPTHQV